MQEKNYRFIMTIYCDSVESYLQNESKNIKKCSLFRKLFKILENIEIWTFFAITSSKFNETTSFQTNFEDNFDGFHIIKSTNFITCRI